MSNYPIISGYHPDPSICRVGDDFFLVNSTFEYFPGVPVFTSRDLLNWEQIGNVLDRTSQLSVRAGIAGASGGIYAPTIRHHDGLFWMTTTNIHEVVQGHLIVHAERPSGPWSEPVYVANAIGIDPDLAWGDDGVCRLSWSDVVRGGISQIEIDPISGEVLSAPKEIWRGTGGAHAEGPHLFERNGWWYLLAAEGGTGAGHMVTVARSRTIDGDFESSAENPLLTHRSTSLPVQATGHADIVELADGSWAMVHLGTRSRGTFPRWHTNGRETFLVGIDWVDDWPVVDEERFEVSAHPRVFTEKFVTTELHPRWIAPGTAPAVFAFPGDGGLLLRAGRTPQARDAEHLLAVRATELSWDVDVEADGDLALVVRIDDAHQAIVERIGDTISARVVIGPLDQIIGSRGSAPMSATLAVRAVPFGGQRGERQGPDRILLGYEDGGFVEIAAVDGRYLSTEVAGGFTGRVIGVEALGADARVTRFSYSGS
ncbi:glycoside hydrolase family 43 protein [Microterricola viridarii]|uniref:Glycosyl hydrolases family 43 n=1 Tax=Microterricola viridarii TaxID=412690 RepID=A0A1H1VAW3_9MICO|nr:glycoside hydrolase family 43 protein [Microterricola viridarii]SDS81875.1 Glycosyl hydrolases family 43 [Microterricola viridarii]